MKNIDLVKKTEGDKYYIRNSKKNKIQLSNPNILELIKLNNLKIKNLLEIGCSDGTNLSIYQKKLKIPHCYGIDLSNKAIKNGKKKYKNIKLKKMSSLDLDKVKTSFDLVICGFFLYLLDREEIFNQFNQLLKILKPNGYLIIEDFDPLFKHSNQSYHNKNLISYKANYTNFLEESGLFKLKAKLEIDVKNSKNIKFKSNEVSVCLYERINFRNKFPYNI